MSHSQEEGLGPAACVTCLRAKFELLSCTVVVWTRALRVLPCGHTVDATWITREAVACHWNRAAFGVRRPGLRCGSVLDVL